MQLTNTTRPGSTEFKIGDRFQISMTGAANQPISVRTTLNGRLDWSPVVARTGASGQWSMTGQFGRVDFGDWTEVWTVGGKLASPTLQFAVSAPCLSNGLNLTAIMSLAQSQTCDTAEGRQTFTTRSDKEAFRTPDGRIIPGRLQSTMTADQYRLDTLQNLIVGRVSTASARELRQLGDEAAMLITKLVGANALSNDETQRALVIIRAAFERLDHLPPAMKDPTVTVPFLQALAKASDQDTLKQQIVQTITYVQRR